MKMIHRLRIIAVVILLAIIPAASLFAADESYIQTLSGRIRKGDSCVVIDDKFLHLPLGQWNMVRNLSVDNLITFQLRQDTNIFYYNRPFTCTLTISVRYFTSRDQQKPTELNNIRLVVRYDTATGAYYPLDSVYRFKNAFKVVVVVESIVSPEWGDKLPDLFRIKNQIMVKRKYPFSQHVKALLRLTTPAEATGASNRVDPDDPADNRLVISWDPADFTNYPSGFGAPEEFDLEWTYIDKLSDRGKAITNLYGGESGPFTIPEATLDEWMRIDNTRVTVSCCSNTISLSYPDGYIVMRVRGAGYDPSTNVRLMSDWQYKQTDDYIACRKIDAHEADLNWQFTASYAEEGKHKDVMTYFDANMKSRQSVTVANTDNVAIVAETVYDNFDRPTLSILPSPVVDQRTAEDPSPAYDNRLKYYPAINRNGDDDPYSYTDITAAGNANCTITAAPLATGDGASNYYSPQNLYINNPDFYFTKYVPDAGGYPFALTEYTADNTGRIRRQGGVGETFQIGGGHETQYFYGKPTPGSLYRLFGLETGIASHYLKNMVVDPNGQISVSYIDASGKTVATALAGRAPLNTDELSSAQQSEAHATLNEVLIRPQDMQADASVLQMEATATFLAAVTGTFNLQYEIDPAALVTSYGSSQQLCNNCYYNVLITVRNDCGDIVASEESTAFQVNDAVCHTDPDPVAGTVEVPVEKIGEYTVSYVLRLDEEVIQYQVDYYMDHNTDLLTLQDFFQQELVKIDLKGCYSECSTCMTNLGTLAQFTVKIKKILQELKDEKYPDLTFDVESPAILSWIEDTYEELYDNCELISLNCQPASPCESRLERMKYDVRPGGQYALYEYDELSGEYSIVDDGTNLLLLYDNSSYTDIYALGYEDGNGNTIYAHDLSESDFIRTYMEHPEWADEFVKQHVEYCSYLWCKDASNEDAAHNNEASYTFDELLRQSVTDGQDAVNRGFYDRGDPYALVDADPFFTGVYGSPYISQMEGDLDNLSDILLMTPKDAGGTPQAGKDVFELIDWALYCSPRDAGVSLTDYLAAWNSCTPDPDCRSLTREWLLYRDYYLKLKVKYMQLAKQAAVPECVNCFVGNDNVGTGDCIPPPPLGQIVAAVTSHDPPYPSTTTVTFNYWDGESCPVGGFADNYILYYQYYVGSTLHYGTTLLKKGECTVADEIIYGEEITGFTLTDIRCLYDMTSGCEDGGEFECPESSDFDLEIDIDYDPCGEFNALLTVTYTGTGLPFPPNQQVTVTCNPYATGSTYYEVVIDNLTGIGSLCIPKGLYEPEVVSVDCEELYEIPASQCTANPSYELYKDKVRIWDEYVNESAYMSCLLGAPMPGEDISLEMMRLQALQDLDALALSWTGKLRAVRDEEGFAVTNATIDDLVADLKLVSQKYIEIAPAENMRPASTLPTTPSVIVSSNGYNNFTEVFTAIIGTTLMEDGFGPELLEQPYPWDKTPVRVNPKVADLDASTCDRLDDLHTLFVAAGGGTTEEFHEFLQDQLQGDYRITVEQLQELIDKCDAGCRVLEKPLTLPGVFANPYPANPDHPWVDCDRVSGLQADFTTLYPDIIPDTRLYRVSITNYLNHQLGFSLSYDDYLDFFGRCDNPGPDTVLLYNLPAMPLLIQDSLSCITDILAGVFENAHIEYVRYRDSVRAEVRNQYISKCLSNSAALRLEGEQYEYHYTLYYYDQSGNLVKTIPPEGVKLLTDEQIGLVEEFIDDSPAACNGSGIPATEDATATFNALSDVLEDNTARSIEMWLYNNTGSAGRQVRIITPDHKYLYQVATKDGKLWAEMYTLQPNATNDVEIKLSAQAVADISGQLTFLNWSHVVVQSSSSLTSGTLKLYFDGKPLTNLSGQVPYPFEWEIDASAGNYVLPGEDIALLKHLRVYDREATDAEVWANYRNSCLGPVGLLAVEDDPLQVWGRFNIPDPGSETTVGPGSTVEWANRFIVPDHYLPTTYAYNSLNQVIRQSSPDGGTSEFWYDRLGRLVVSQNEEQKNPQEEDDENPDDRYSYTWYDDLGRITEVGERINESDAMTEDLARDPEELDDWLTLGINRQVTYTVYDKAPAWAPASLTGTQFNLRKRVAATTLIGLSVGSFAETYAYVFRLAASYYSYDIIGNVHTLVQENKELSLAEADYITGGDGLKQIKYEYDLQSGKVNKVLYQDGKWDQFYYQYIYDADNRLEKALSSRINEPDPALWVTEASYRYYLHGPLARMQLGKNKVQGTDYAYTLQGWLKGVNGQFLDPDKDMSSDGKEGSPFDCYARDVLAFSLGYYNQDDDTGPDYAPVGGSGANAFAMTYQPPVLDPLTPSFETGKNLFNGNIGHATYAIKHLGDDATIGYTYRYDQLNRLTATRRHNIASNATTWDNTGIIQAYREDVSYDANGNIETYFRNGAHVTGMPLPMDNLTYGYNKQYDRKINNRLRHVKEDMTDPANAGNYSAATNGTADIDNQEDDNYTYDKIGNLVSDAAEKIDRINWTVYGKIASIQKDGDQPNDAIRYGYDAGGNRITKSVSDDGNLVATTFYVRDGQGNLMGVYKLAGGAEPTYTWQEQHLYGSSRLGMIMPGLAIEADEPLADDEYEETGDPINNGIAGKRIYEMNNHLTNVLVTISDEKTGVDEDSDMETDYYVAEVIMSNDYYPAGMLQPGRTYQSGSSTYRYTYQGQFSEKDDETKWNSFELRMYDNRLGRWISTDPYGQYPSPYDGMGNNWLNGIDPDGGYLFGLFGSTSKQRQAAKDFKEEHGGKIRNYNRKDINVEYYRWGGSNKYNFTFGNEKPADPNELEGLTSSAYRAFFDRKTGEASDGEYYDYFLKTWKIIEKVTEYTPNMWNSWQNSSGWFGKATYSIADGFWVTAQNLGGKFFNKDMTTSHIGGGITNNNENVEAFVSAAPSVVPIGRIPAAVNYLKYGGPTFSQAKKLIWSTTAKPTFKSLTNETTGQVFKVYAEIHHRFVPQRWGFPNWITNNRLNLQITNSIEHAVKDPYRYQFLPKWVKEAVDNGSLKGLYY